MDNKLKTICRACMLESTQFRELFAFDELTDQTHGKSLSICSNIRVSPDDSLPQIICEDCIYELRIAFKFRDKSRKVDVELRQKYQPYELNDPLEMNNHEDIKVAESTALDLPDVIKITSEVFGHGLHKKAKYLNSGVEDVPKMLESNNIVALECGNIIKDVIEDNNSNTGRKDATSVVF